MASRRLFVATPIPDEMHQVLASCSSIIEHPDIRWTPPENLHITLLFIGSVKEEEIPGMKKKLAVVAAGTHPFQLQCEEVTVIKKRGRANMIWARFKQESAFVTLVKQTSAALSIPLDRHPLPHITLARVKNGKTIPINSSMFPAIRHLAFQVDRIGLWESQLKPTGADYSVMEQWHLKK